MKKVLSTYILLLYILSAYGQDGKYMLLNLGIKDESIINKSVNIEIRDIYFEKIKYNLIKTSGIILDNKSEYLILSDFKVLNRKSSNAGILPINILNIELTLSFINSKDKKYYNYMSLAKEYTCNTESEGLRMFVNDLQLDQKELNEFIYQGRKSIENYYAQNCEDIINTIKRYQTTQEYDKALAFCSFVPTDVPCFNLVDTLANALYTLVSYHIDYRIFQSAQKLVSVEQYQGAIDSLKQISINSAFYKMSLDLTENINSYIISKRSLESQQNLKLKEIDLKNSEIKLQEKKNIMQEGINSTNIEIARLKNEAESKIKSQEIYAQKEIRLKEIDANIKIEQINKDERELEIDRQLKKEEMNLQKRNLELEYQHQSKRDKLVEEMFLKQLLTQPNQFTIIR